MAQEFEFTVHFQKGSRVGARRTRMEHLMAVGESHAVAGAKAAFPDFRAQGFRIVRVDHFDGAHIVIDWER